MLYLRSVSIPAAHAKTSSAPRRRTAVGEHIAEVSLVVFPKGFVPTKPSVLIVDDSADGREMLMEYLAFRKFHVTEARNGEEAIEVARLVRPHIILMDLSMPAMDGWKPRAGCEPTRSQKRRSSSPSPPAHCCPSRSLLGLLVAMPSSRSRLIWWFSLMPLTVSSQRESSRSTAGRLL